jgi:transcriptional regulator with XRE-family HTH domain
MVSGPAATPEWADYAKQLGINLRRARDAKGYTQEKMAELTGISLYAYQQYERGTVTRGGAPTNPRLATVIAICQALGVGLEEMAASAPLLVQPSTRRV